MVMLWCSMQATVFASKHALPQLLIANSNLLCPEGSLFLHGSLRVLVMRVACVP
jgi:hypothetical protein